MSQVNIEGGRITGIDKLEDVVTGNSRIRGRWTGMNSVSKRFELNWVAGQRGRPALNAVMAWPAVYAAAASQAIETSDKHFELLGVNGVSANVTYYAEGGISMVTAGADGDEMILLPHLDTDQTPWTNVTWGTDKEVEWEALIQSGPVITNSIIWAGLKLTNTEVKATDNDQVYFRFEDDINSGKFEVVESLAGVDTVTDTGVAAEINTQYHLKIVIDAARVAKCYINGALVRTTVPLTDATDLKPYIGVAADGAAAAKTLRVFGQSISRKLG